MNRCGALNLGLAPILYGLAVFAIACVPRDAGYGDVREVTKTRIAKDVVWYEHDAAPAADEKVRQLLARPLDADAAVQIALFKNPSLQAAFEELGLARADLVQALHVPNPTLDAALKFMGSERPEIDLSLLLDVSGLLLISSKNGVAGALLDAAKIKVAGDVLDLALEVRVMFYEYQAAVQTLELRRAIVEALRASFDAATALHEAGNISDLNLSNERALYEEERLALGGAEASARALRHELEAAMGLWQEPLAWSVVPRLSEASSLDHTLQSLEHKALEQSLDLAEIRERYRAAANGVDLAKLHGALPELKAGVAVEREEGWEVGPAIAVELPLFYQGQAETGARVAEMRKQYKLLAATGIRIRSAARALTVRLRATLEGVDYYKRVLLPLRDRILNETELQYNSMGVGIFQLLSAKRDQIASLSSYVMLLRDYWILRSQAEQLLSGRLPRRALSASRNSAMSAPEAASFVEH